MSAPPTAAPKTLAAAPKIGYVLTPSPLKGAISRERGARLGVVHHTTLPYSPHQNGKQEAFWGPVEGRLIANEMAPRVHNSGHWTIEGCVTSQFENHLRAICDLPLGSTRALGHTAMINFLGALPDRDRLLSVAGLAFHDYGKEPRPGRKLGHCTILKSRATERNRALSDTLKWVKWT